MHFSFILQRSIISQAFLSGKIFSYLHLFEISSIILRNKITIYTSPRSETAASILRTEDVLHHGVAAFH